MQVAVKIMKSSPIGRLNREFGNTVNIEKPSWPVLFLASKFLITSTTSSSVIGLKKHGIINRFRQIGWEVSISISYLWNLIWAYIYEKIIEVFRNLIRVIYYLSI